MTSIFFWQACSLLSRFILLVGHTMRLLVEGRCQPEHAPKDVMPAQTGQVSLQIGAEQRRDDKGRVYFLDHGKRTTAWADPRQEEPTREEPAGALPPRT